MEIKDGFKFGCGWFLASVVIGVIGIILAILFLVWFLRSITPETLTETIEKAETYQIGEEVPYNGLTLTVISFGKYTETSKWYQPEKGKEYVKVEMEIRNKTNKSKEFGRSDFDLYDKEGKEYWDTSLVSLELLLENQYIEPEGKIKGYLVFEVLKGASNFTLVIQEELFGDKKAIKLWELK